MNNKIHLHRDELAKILKLVDVLNPPTEDYQSSRLVITSDSSSGIGSILSVEIPIVIDGIRGTFVKVISDEKDW